MENIKTWTFPGGERGVCLEEKHTHARFKGNEPYWLRCDFKGSDDLIDLMLKVDAVRRTFGSKVDIKLDIPYFPYARQDRVMQVGESHSLKVIADLINSMNFSEVCIVDPHSDVVEALVDNAMLVWLEA